MIEEREPEELAASNVLDELARRPGAESGEDTAPVPPGVEAEAVEVLHRLYLESVGLLAYELEPVPPSAGARDRLLHAALGDETQEVPTILAPPPARRAPVARPLAPMAPVAPTAPVAPIAPIAPVAPMAPTAPTAPVAPVAPDASPKPPIAPSAAPAVTAAPAPAPVPPAAVDREPPAISPAPRVRLDELRPATPPEPTAFRESASVARRPSRWPLALAALFALAAIGLGLWVAELQSEVAYRDARLRKLETDLSAAANRERELAETRLELARIQKLHEFATAPSTTVFALRPPLVGAGQPLARAQVYLAANHRDWRMEVRGLKPETETEDYQLWLIIDGKPVPGGVFDARLGQVASIGGDSMPGGVSALAITLEKKGGSPAPTSPILLLGETSRGVQI